MLCLAIDTSTKTGGAAVVDGDKILGEYVLDLERKTHSERVIPAIDSVLKGIGITVNDLGAIAIAYGPGSFTGLRIGLATAKALSFSLQVPLFKIDTLEALASQLSYLEGIICPILNARRNEVYAALWQSDGHSITCLKDSRALPLDELLGDIPPTDKLFFVGEGAQTAESVIKAKLPFSRIIKGTNSILHPATIALRALESPPADVDLLVPNYLRKSEAENKKKL